MPQGPRGRWAKWYATVVADKAHYPAEMFAALALVVARAADRNDDGKVDRPEVLEALVARWGDGPGILAYLVDQHDVVIRRGWVVVVGWKVYQPAPDRTAAERQRRRRDRLRAEGVTASLSQEPLHVSARDDDPIGEVTPLSRRDTVTRSPSLSNSDSRPTSERTTLEDGASPARVPAPAPAHEGFEPDLGLNDPELPALSWLASHGAYIAPTGGGYHRTLAGLVERHGIEATITALGKAEVAGARTPRQYVFAITDLLDVVPSMRPVAREDAAAERERERLAASASRSEATRRRIAELRALGDETG